MFLFTVLLYVGLNVFLLIERVSLAFFWFGTFFSRHVRLPLYLVHFAYPYLTILNNLVKDFRVTLTQKHIIYIYIIYIYHIYICILYTLYILYKYAAYIYIYIYIYIKNYKLYINVLQIIKI